MEILPRDLPARFDTGDFGGPSVGGAMILTLSAFEARTDMLECTRAVSDGAPRAVRIKIPEEIWGAVLEGVLRMHDCVNASGLTPVYTVLAAKPKGVERIALKGLYQTRANTTDAATSIPPVCLPPHKRLFCGVSSPRHELEQLGERDIPAASLGHVNHADTGAFRCAA